MSRTEHGERIRSRQREIILRAGCAAALALALAALWGGLLTWAAAEDEPKLETVLAYVPVPAPDPEVVVVVRYATEEEEAQRDRETVEAIARTVWGEARGCTTTEQAAVVWCVLNRADRPEWPDDPLEVVQQPGQFAGYDPENPVWPEMLALVEDVLDRWELEKTAVGDVGRVLPKEYVYFDGDGRHNYFWTEWRGVNTWDWGLDSPYN